MVAKSILHRSETLRNDESLVPCKYQETMVSPMVSPMVSKVVRNSFRHHPQYEPNYFLHGFNPRVVRSPSSAPYTSFCIFFGGECSPSKRDHRTKLGTLILPSLLEDLDSMNPNHFFAWFQSQGGLLILSIEDLAPTLQPFPRALRLGLAEGGPAEDGDKSCLRV